MALRFAFAIAAAAFAVAGCQRIANAPSGENSRLSEPAEESSTARVFQAVNDAAKNQTGELTISTALRLPDQAGADSQEVVTMSAAKGMVAEAQLVSEVTPSTQVQGQTLRALLQLSVDEPQTLVYRVSSETRPAGVSGLCGADRTAFVIVWEPTTPGESTLKVLGFTGGQPGAADTRACSMMEYVRP
ncbi:MAG: hypothetical protein ABL883_02720 [Terricaulis sp.]